jgi:hypothetical protein
MVYKEIKKFRLQIYLSVLLPCLNINNYKSNPSYVTEFSLHSCNSREDLGISSSGMLGGVCS